MTPAKAVATCTKMIRALTVLRNEFRALAVHGMKKHAHKLPRKRRSVVRVGMRFRSSNGNVYKVIATAFNQPGKWKCVPVKAVGAPNLLASADTILAKRTQFQPRKAW